MNKILISIIIPVYNAEKYIDACLESVFSQSNNNFEVIVINDGCTDNSGVICEQFAKENPRMIYVKQVNAGVSAARNSGLSIANGDVIMFVDADDLLKTQTCQIITDTIGENDLIIMGMQQFTNAPPKSSKNETDYYKVRSLNCISKSDYIKALLGDDKCKQEIPANLASVCGKAYKKDLIKNNNILFPLNIPMGEDLLFNLLIFLHDPKVGFIEKNMYYYRYNTTSVVHKYNSKVKENDDKFFMKLTDYLKEDVLYELKDYIDYLKLNGLIMILSNDVFHYDNPRNNSQRKRQFLSLINRKEYIYLLKTAKKNTIARFSKNKKLLLLLCKYKMYFSLKTIFLIKYCIKK